MKKLDEKMLIETMRQMMREEMEPMRADIRALKDDMRTVKDDLNSVKADVAQIPDMRRDINLILEGQQGINDKFKKLDQVAEDVEESKAKVTALETVTKDNTSQIRELKIAK